MKIRKYKIVIFSLLAVLFAFVLTACKKTVELSFNPNGGMIGGSTEVKKISVEKNKVVANVPTASRDGYDFVAWKNSEDTQVDFATFKPTKNEEFKAEWKEKTAPVPEQTFKVIIPSEVSLVSPEGIDLNKVKKDTTLTFKVVVPADKVLEKVLVNDTVVAVDAENKFSTTITKETIISVALSDKTTPVEKFKVTIPAEVECLDAGVDLNNVVKNTELTFKVNVPANKKIKKLLVNGEDKVVDAINQFKVAILSNTEISVEFEEVHTFSVSIPADGSIKALDASVDLTKVNKGTTLRFKVVVPSNKVIDKLLVNGAEITPNSDNEFDVLVNDNTTITVSFKEDPILKGYADALKQEFEEIEQNIKNDKLELPNKYSEVNEANILAAINQWVDSSICEVSVSKKGDKYEATLTHKANNTVKESRVYSVVIAKKKLTLTLPSEVQLISPNVALNDITEGSEVVLKVLVPTDKEIKTLTINDNPVDLTQVNSENQYQFRMTKNTQVSVVFQYSAAVNNAVQNELDKVSDPLELVVPDGNLTVDLVKNAIKALIDETKVKLEVSKINNNTFNVKVSHKNYDDLSKEKEVVITIAKVNVSVNFAPGKYDGQDSKVFQFNKGATLRAADLPQDGADPLLEIPAGHDLKEYQVNGTKLTTQVLNNDISVNAIYEASAKHRVIFKIKATDSDVLDKDAFNKTYKVDPNTVFNNPFTNKPIKPGYEFIRWESNGAEHNFNDPITADTTIEAIFKTESYLKFKEINDGYGVEGFANYIDLNNPQVTEIYIPTTFNGKKVYSILKWAFSNKNFITKLVLPENGHILEIGAAAFINNVALKEVKLGNTVTTIGEYAFSGAKFSSIVIPESLTVMGYKSFGVANLANVTFVSTTYDNISKMPFEDSKWLVDGAKNAQNMLVVNGTLVSVDVNKCANLTIPSNVKRIGEGAFYNLEVKSITFSEGLEHIGNEAFAHARFNANTKLVFPKSLKTIGFRAFAFARNIESIEFPSDSELRYLRAEAFRRNTKLEEVKFGEKLETIGQKVFFECNQLARVNAPASVKTVGYKAFMETEFRTNSVNAHEKKLFVYNHILLDTYSFIEADLELTPEITSIAERAIYRSKTLQSVVIPDTVKLIKKHALYHFGAIRKIIISGQVTTIEEGAFILKGYYINASKESDIHQLSIEIQDIKTKPAGWHEEWKKELVTPDGSPLFAEAGLPYNKIISYKWGEIVSLKYDLNGGVAAGINKEFYKLGETPKEPSIYPTKDGHTFIGWYLDDSHYLFNEAITKTLVLKARYVANNSDYELRYENKELIFTKLLNKTLTEFSIPDKVEDTKISRIDNEAFANHPTLKKVVIGENVLAIGRKSFSGATQLEDIQIGANVSHFGGHAFANTKWLTSKRNTDRFVVVNNVLVDAINIGSDEVLPNGITKIAEDAFDGNNTTTKLTLNQGVVEICSYAFRNATSLTSIILPASLKTGVVRANAFAIGGTNNVSIDASSVHFTKPNSWEDGYDNGNGATLTFNWDSSVTTYQLTLAEGITLEDKSLNPNKIAAGTSVVFMLAEKEFYSIKKFEVDGADKTASIVDGKYTHVINKNTVLSLEYQINDDIRDEVTSQKNKLAAKIGYELKDSNRKKSIISHLELFLDTKLVKIELTSDDKVRLYSTKAKDYYQETDVISFVRVFSVNGTDDVDLGKAKASGMANYNERASQAFNGEEYDKWCDNTGARPKWLIGELKQNMFVSKFKIAHASVKESASMNTREFKLFVSPTTDGDDWEEVADVKNLNQTYSEHGFSGKVIRRVKMVVTKAEQAGNTTRIYELYIFAEKQTVKLTFNLNGGNIDGETENVVIDHLKNTPIRQDEMPQPVKKFYQIEKWLYNNQPVKYTEPINEERLFTVKWKVSPTVVNTLEEELAKIPARVYVVKDAGELTNDDILNKLNSYIDTTNTILSIQKNDGEENKYRVVAKFKQDPTVFATKEVEVFKKLSTDKNSITFKLIGGKFNTSSENVVKEFDKGYVLKSEDIIEVLKEHYNFITWLDSDGKFKNLVGHIVDANIEVSAKWHIKNEIVAEVQTELNKIPNIFGIKKDGEIEHNDVSAYLVNNTNQELVSTTATLDGENYNIVIRSKKADYAITKVVACRRLVEITLPDCLELVGIVGNLAMVGDFVQLRAIANPAHRISNIQINDVDYFLDSNNLITFKVEDTTTVTAEHTLDKQLAMEHLNKVLAKVPDQLTFDNPENLSKEDIEESFADIDFEGLDLTIERYQYDWKVVLANSENSNYKASKVIEITSMKKIDKGVEKHYYSDYDWYIDSCCSPAEDDNQYSNAFDESGECDFTKAYVSTEESKAFVSGGKQHILFMLNLKEQVKYTLRIYHAGAMAGGNPEHNTKDFEISYARTWYTTSPSSFNKLKTVTNNTANYTDVEIDNTKIKKNQIAMAITVSNGTQNGEKRFTLVGAQLFEGAELHKVDFNLGGAKYNERTTPWMFKIKSGALIPENMVPECELENHEFKGYRFDGEVIDRDTLLTKKINKDTVIELVFERNNTPEAHSVVFKYNGGTSTTPGEDEKTIQVYDNEYIMNNLIPTLTKEHHVFSHWENQETPGEVFNFNQPVNGELELTAIFKINPEYEKDLNNNFNKIYHTLYVESASDNPSIDEIKNAIKAILTNKDLLVNVELVADNKYKITLTHNHSDELVVEREVLIYKKTLGELDVVLTYNDDMSQEQTIKVRQGELLDATKLQNFSKEGYEFLCWQDSDTNELIDINSYQVSKASNLKALYKIDNSTLPKFNDLLNEINELGFDKEEADIDDVKGAIENNLQAKLGATLAGKLNVVVTKDGSERFRVEIQFEHNDLNQIINLIKWVNTYKN